jgi:hypothetical protein
MTAACQDAVMKAIDDPKVFVFGELLDVPNVQVSVSVDLAAYAHVTLCWREIGVAVSACGCGGAAVRGTGGCSRGC